MRKIRFFSAVFGLLGCAAAALGIWLALSNLHAGPVLVEVPREARAQAQTLLDALAEGDFDRVSGSISGNPDLGIHRKPADPVGQLVWEALAESFSWECAWDFYATESGVAVDVLISCLDLDSVTRNLRTRAAEKLQQRVAQAEDTAEIYDENNDYREALVREVLLEAAKEALEEDGERSFYAATLNLVYENGGWMIQPEEALLRAVSGGILD